MFKQERQLERLSKYHSNKAQQVLDAWTETWLSEDFKDWKLDDYLNQVYYHLLVVHGEIDEYGSLAQPQRFIQHASGTSQMSIIANTRHMPHKKNQIKCLRLFQHF